MIKLELELGEVNQILTVLGEAPFKIAQPLIARIQQQAQPQANPPPPPQKANGVDETASA